MADSAAAASKQSPDDPRFDLPRASARKLRKAPVVVLLVGAALVFLVALYFALQHSSQANEASAPVAIDTDSIQRTVPEGLRLNDSDFRLAEDKAPEFPKLGPPLQGDMGGFQLRHIQEQATPSVPVIPDVKPTPVPALPKVPATTPAYVPPPAKPQPSPEDLERARLQRLHEEAMREAQHASIFFQTGQRSSSSQTNNAVASVAAALPQKTAPPSQRAVSASSVAQWQPAKSPYTVYAGSMIPATLLTGINSDVPGQIIAQVREQVFDTVTGRYLLIPQGTRLLGEYDSRIGYGQNRAQVIWTRMIFPDGSSVQLENMPGVDSMGQAGYTDTVNHHWGRVITGAVLSSLLAGTSGVAGERDGFEGEFYQNAGSEINRFGQRFTKKNLTVQPTIQVRPGYSVNVLVNHDLILKPWQAPGW